MTWIADYITYYASRVDERAPAPDLSDRLSRWIYRTTLDLIGFTNGAGLHGIPGGMAIFDVRIPWLRDRHGNQWCASCRCTTCGARRSFLYPIRRMAMHVERLHLS